MIRTMYKSKINRATLTQCELHYTGSITIPAEVLEAADVLPGERVQVVNINNGERLETYTIKGKRGDGNICLNGPAARRGMAGDHITIISYCQLEDAEARALKPRLVLMGDDNQITKTEILD